MSANANIKAQQLDGSTALMRACYFNHYDLASYLLERRVEVNATNIRHETALYIAAFRGHTELVDMLIKNYNADVNICDKDGDTALSVACYENKPDTIYTLLKYNTIVNIRGVRGDTPLHVAVCNCNNDIVEKLIQSGADVDAVNDSGETPLHLAVRDDNMEIFKTLILHAKNLDQCTSVGSKTVLKLLLLENVEIYKIKMAACLVKAGCDVNKSFNKRTVLRMAQPTNPINDQYRILANILNGSPFQHLFQMPRFKSQKRSVQDKDPICFLVYLVELLIKAGYSICLEDFSLFKNSWVHEYLMQEDPNALNILNELFRDYTVRPASLVNLCKFQVRSLLVKPLFNSIDKLNIPLDLKAFLYLDY